jgi:predicted NBD/HSP70 family sugar kinase
MKKTYYLGIDIGGTKCAVVAGTEEMEILDRIQFATKIHKGPDYAISKLLESSSNLVKRISDYKLAAIGISCGGPLDSKTGIIQSSPNLPGWDNIEMVNREALKPARDVCEIVPAALGDKIGDYACLSVAMSHQNIND